ncbi:restriction endonuclease subunit S [Paraburkholderia youngii]|uniref:restriction endonuclease subunit S n=1 Tax=Paraburkholderia youngii TaxID=2782701 RepID=UPI001C3799A7|nr:hypothetical protein [Paraburkholderia youngii]
MSWDMKPLGAILEQSGHDRAGDREFPVLSITMRHGLVDQTEKFKKRVASQDTSNYRIAHRNELVVGFPIDEGVLGFQTKYPAGIVSPAYDVWRLKAEADCHIPYLERYLRSTQARRLYASRMQGAVARRRSLTKADFLKLEIPVPPVDDQIRIAYLLGKVERMIVLRNQHLQQLDALLNSVFLDMFGDPMRNEKGWKTGSLDSYGSFKNGLNFGKAEAGVKVRYLGVGDFKGHAKIDEMGTLSYLDLNTLPTPDYFLKDGDLVFVRSNGNRELVGRCLVIYPGSESVTYSGFCIRFRIETQMLNATYIVHMFRTPSIRRALFQGGQGANIQNINQKILAALPIPLPPIKLQSDFSEIVNRIEGLKLEYRQSLADLGSLYGVLSQRAFKGELDLSRVPLSDTAQQELPPAMYNDVEPIATTPQSIFLPETNLVHEAMENRERIKDLLEFWLEAYRSQLGSATFSAQSFMSAAQFRLSELHSDDDFALGSKEYEHIKAWVFAALADGRLLQVRNITEQVEKGGPIFGNLVELKYGART